MGEAAGLAIVCGLVAAAWWLARRRHDPAAGVERVLPVGAGARLVAVVFGGRRLILAVNRQGDVRVIRDDEA